MHASALFLLVLEGSNRINSHFKLCQINYRRFIGYDAKYVQDWRHELY